MRRDKDLNNDLNIDFSHRKSPKKNGRNVIQRFSTHNNSSDDSVVYKMANNSKNIIEEPEIDLREITNFR
jgi:hypothetical protein